MSRLSHILLLLPIALMAKGSPPVPITQPVSQVQTDTSTSPNADLLRHISIAYYPSATQAYDYDAPGAGLPPVAQFDSYEVNGKTLQIPAKALADAGTDPVLVSVRKASTAPAGEVVFRYGNGDAVTITSRADTLWTLSLARPTAGDDEVWAWYLWRDSLDKPRESPLLKFNLGVYGGASQKLVVVPVNGVSCPVTKEALQNVLDDTYGQVAQKWTASIAAKLSVPAWDDNADGVFNTSFSDLAATSGDMQAVIKAMKAVGSYDEDTYYLFLIDAPQDRNPAFDGYMPVSSQFGFIFTRETSATTIAKTIAHELGHGAYNLEHTPDPPMGATTNLMDYAPAGLRLHHAQWDNIEDPEWRPLANWGDESEGAMMASMPNYFGQKVTTPIGSKQGIHEDAVPIQDENDYTIAFITPDEKVFLWVDEGQWEGYFENGVKALTSGYLFYVEDKYMRESDPLSWGIYLAANDLGDFAIDMVEAPGETTKNLATGIWKIATLQFDFEKTWERILSADRTDGAYVVSTLALGYLAGPKCKKLVLAEEAPQFQEMLGQYASKARPLKLTWPELLALFKKAREFEKLVSRHLKTMFKVEEGFSVTSQVYLKVEGVMSIADDIIYNSKTKQYILNESKYGATNLLSKNQQVIENAIKAGKEIEIRSLEGIRDATGTLVKTQGQTIRITKILRSNSVDGTISTNIVKTVWP